MNKPYKLGILLFNEVEVLDFAGPFEVFSITARPEGGAAFSVTTIGQTTDLITARNGLKVKPDYDFTDAPQYDILIVPGGYGAEEVELHNISVLNWVREQAKGADLVASVCTGAFILAEAGMLEGKRATTHWMDVDRLEREYPTIRVVRNVKYVDEGSIMSSCGISGGINLAFHIVEKLLGTETARETAHRMEYDIVIGETGG